MQTQPEAIVQKQLDAYNRRDLDAFCACFAGDVRVYKDLVGTVAHAGKAAFREVYRALFADSPALHCDVVKRVVEGAYVIDQEKVSGRRGKLVEATAIYRIEQDLIAQVWFLS